MNSEQLAYVFSHSDCSHIYEKLEYPLEVSNFLEEVEEDQLDHFLSSFDFSDQPSLFFDEFKYLFSIHQCVYRSFRSSSC
ncbi:MAG TPA: hypothetical protein VEY51_12390 [Chondromyces sp.]|nr:hypothetical protein [Chondromyces sp.]